LGDLVQDRWRARRYDDATFPAIAEAALRELPPAEHLGAYDPLTWLVQASTIPKQRVEMEPFGQPPVQVYVTSRFFIETLYWIDGTTAIHQHAFNGAFHVLAGSSIHCLYSFDERTRMNSAVLLGELRRDALELLTRGDTRPILAGRAMRHSLFHLDRPSVTVVVRTYNVADSGPQYNYSLPGL